MANKPMKRRSTSLVIGEIQMKTTMTYHFIPTRISRIKETITSMSKDVDKWSPHTLLVVPEYGAHTLENGLMVPQKVSRVTMCISNSTPRNVI